MAGVSATWYTWLEQKRPIGVSSGVLENLARVLRLDPAERMQLFQLALRQPVLDNSSQTRNCESADCGACSIKRIRSPHLSWGVDGTSLRGTEPRSPSFSISSKCPPNERNTLWLFFTNPALRSLIVDWRSRAQDTLARFRADYGRHAGDAHFVQLVERLKSVSPEFAEWWPRHDILPRTEGRNAYDHPLAGRMVVEHTTFSVVDNPELRLVVFLAAAASNSIAKMKKIVASFHSGSPSSGIHRRSKPRKKLRLSR